MTLRSRHSPPRAVATATAPGIATLARPTVPGDDEHTELRRLVAETICNNIDISFYRWGHLGPEAHATIMKTANAVIAALTAGKCDD